MSQQAPPPLPNGGPPPPLPSGLPPPMPVGGLPPPPMGGLPPPPMGHMQMHGGPRGRNNTPFTNVVLITHLPPFVGGYQQVKDWLYPCGTTKSCFFYPKDKNVKKTVLIHMAFPDQAVKVVASFQKFASKLDERYQEMKCFMVPSSPDVPLPPVLLDETSQEVLGEKLWNNFVGLETTQEAPESTQEAPSQKEPKLLDADKVAAAAGGALGYDADEDPLNAPQVLEAVKAFRRKLDKTQGSQKTQRMELVAKKLQELRPKIRAQVDAEKALPVPPPSLSLPPPPPTMDSGKRGRSNLPAWMTQQQQQQPSKKAKTHPSNFPSSLPPSSHPILKEFLAQQVKESMGEEEATLIDFLYRHILEGKSTADLLQELKVVLEEEADAFLDAVWTKVQALENS